LSKMFRGKYVDGVARLLQREELDLPPQLSALGKPAGRRRLLRQWRRKSWVVYSKAPFAGPRKLVDYLGCYTHRVAISNERIIGIANDQEAFRVRADAEGKKRVLRLAGSEFIARFLLHVLPSGFKRIRHYGLLSPARKKVGLAVARSALAVPPPDAAIIESVAAFLHRVARLESMCCPHCGGLFRVTATLLPQHGATARGPP